MKRLVLLDGHAILHRAFHALPPLTTSSGQLVNAVFGFTSMLLRIIEELKPTHLLVAFDLPQPTFRQKIFPEYQAQRPEMAEELAGQIDLVWKILKEMGIPIFALPGYEADDVLGTMAEKAKRDFCPEKEGEILVVTGDRDLFQLVDSQTKVYLPVKGLSQGKIYGEKEVEEKLGIKPKQLVDYKALVGDPSDNYPGIPGIGPKTACRLLQRFGSLEEIYEKISQIEEKKIQQALKENREKAETAKKLATIVRTVPLALDFAQCQLPDFTNPTLFQLFEDLEFRSLLPRLFSLSSFAKGEKEEKKKEKKEKIAQPSLF